MYKTKQNYLRFKTHEIFSDKFSKEYPKEQQATYWYQIWFLINSIELLMKDWNFDTHEVAKDFTNKWLELWPFPLNNTIGGAPAFQKVPTLVEGTDYLCEKYNLNGTWTTDYKISINRFSVQVIYGVLVDLFKDVLKVEQEQVNAFLLPLKDYDKKRFAITRQDTIKAIVGMSDFFMNTKDLWIETKEFGDWRIKDSERVIAEWKQGFVDHKTPDDYPLDKSKIIDHRKGVDDNRWTREKPFLEDEDLLYGQREEV
tara:strand:+ start:118 stop:885 length:768 start_codon:yes stop_codon:yes gene_type:complete